MDVVNSGGIQAFGTTAVFKGTPSPQTATGRTSGAIYLPNVATSDDAQIDLGQLDSTCTDNVNLCNNGYTLAVWMKFQSRGVEYASVMSGSSGAIMMHCPAHADVMHPILNLWYPDRGVYAESWLKMKLSYGEWHLFGISFSKENKYRFFVDGCEIQDFSLVERSSQFESKSIQLGCQGNAHCSRIYYDDFWIWETEKSNRFMWHLFNEL
jgi:hypothetical protein